LKKLWFKAKLIGFKILINQVLSYIYIYIPKQNFWCVVIHDIINITDNFVDRFVSLRMLYFDLEKQC